MKKLFGLVAVVALAMAMSVKAETIKVVSWAVNEVYNSSDGAQFKAYLTANGDIDFGSFDYGKAASYFINADFKNGETQYKTIVLTYGANDYRYFIYNADKYELVSDPTQCISGSNMAAVFQDVNGEQFALVSVRGTYKDDKIPATLGPVKTYVEENVKTPYPNARVIVTYNARLTGTYTSGNTYPDILDTYLVENASGPQMLRLGRNSVGGFYTYSDSTPLSYSVADADASSKYLGTLLTATYPTKYRVIFEDHDGTGLQTNVVSAGGSVTPPIPPERPGFEFVGWDHEDAEFVNVTKSFTATAQYETAGNSHLVTYLDWKGELLSEVAVEDGELCYPPEVPARPDYEFAGWTTNGVPFDLITPVKEDLTLTASYMVMALQETASAEDFLRRIQAAYPTGTVIRLTKDIDLGKAQIVSTNFYGVLDGDGHTITGIADKSQLFSDLYGTVKNLTIDSIDDGDQEDRVARSLIAKTAYGARIENCVFTNCHLRGSGASNGASLACFTTYANGGVVTVISNVTAVNCSVLSKGTFSSTMFGGFVRSAKDTDFISCRFLTDDRESVSVGGTGLADGGIAGESQGNCRFIGCYNEGKVVSSVCGNNYMGAGGIVGGASGNTEVYDCTNVAEVIGCQQEGTAGIVARACKCSVLISGCVNRGKITSQYGGAGTNPSGIGAGGLISGNWGSGSTIKILDSANYGDIDTTTNNCYAGGLVGSFDSSGNTLYITNAFNYGKVTSERYAGGIVGRVYNHGISVANVGNSGDVTSTGARAGGFIGLLGNGSHHMTYKVDGFLNCGTIVGAMSASPFVGGYEETGNYIDTHLCLCSGILAGSASVSDVDGTVGALAGALILTGDKTCVLVGSADENCRVLQQGLVDYYNSEGAKQLDPAIPSMVQADLTNGNSRKILDGYAAANGLVGWVQGAKCPELSMFAQGEIPEPAMSGLLILFR